MGLKTDASGVMLGATLVDQGSELNAEVSSELGLDLEVNLGTDSGLDRRAESSRELGTETKVNVDEATIEQGSEDFQVNGWSFLQNM